MAYRHDRDLEFMDRATHDDLQNLVYVLTHDPKDGETRWTEELSSKLKGCDDHHYRWQDIAGELQCFGGDTFANMFRGGKGVEYRELLCDICDVCKIKYDKKATNIEDIENALVSSHLGKMWESWDRKSRSYVMAISRFFVAPGQINRYAYASAILSSAMPTMLSTGLLGGGITSLMLAQMTTGIATASVTRLGATALTSSLGMSTFTLIAPRLVGLVIPATTLFSLLTIGLSFSGPAYRVTLPACLAVAELRKKAALTPREILRMKKLEEIIRKMQESLEKVKANENKIISMYIFAYQVMLHFNFNDDESLKAIIFGLTNFNIITDEEIGKRKNISLDQSITNAKDAGYSKAELANTVMAVGELGEIQERDLTRFIDSYL